MSLGGNDKNILSSEYPAAADLEAYRFLNAKGDNYASSDGESIGGSVRAVTSGSVVAYYVNESEGYIEVEATINLDSNPNLTPGTNGKGKSATTGSVIGAVARQGGTVNNGDIVKVTFQSRLLASSLTTTFVSLTDTPGSIVAQQGLVGNAGGTALENATFVRQRIATVTGLLTTLDDTYDFVILDGSGGDCTVTLPDPSANTGRIYSFKSPDSTSNTVKIARFGSENIDGSAADYTFTSDNEYIRLISDGTDWWII